MHEREHRKLKRCNQLQKMSHSVGVFQNNSVNSQLCSSVTEGSFFPHNQSLVDERRWLQKALASCKQTSLIQKYLLPYHQTMEQLHSSGCETLQSIINTPFSKKGTPGLKGIKHCLVFFSPWWFKRYSLCLQKICISEKQTKREPDVTNFMWHCCTVELQIL